MSLFKHMGCTKKKYKFEMHIQRVVLTSDKRKLFTRVLWTRHNEKKSTVKFHTKWCEGVENYNMDETIYHEATIYFASNTNQIQSKQTKITLQIRERIDGKDNKFAKFSLDLAKYVDLLQPHHLFYQRLNYEKARKRAQLIFTVKSMEILEDGTVSDYTDNEEEEFTEDESEAVLSVASLNAMQNAQRQHNMDTFNSLNKNTAPFPTKNKRNSAPNAMALHSDISGKQLKHRHYRNQSATTPSSSNKENSNSDKRGHHKQSEQHNQHKPRKHKQHAVPPSPGNPTPTPDATPSAPSNSPTATNTSTSAATPHNTSSNVTITRRDQLHAHVHNSTHHEQNAEKFVRANKFTFNGASQPRHRVTSSGSHDRSVQEPPPNSPTAASSSASEDILELKRKLKIFEDKHKKYKFKYAKLLKKVEEQEIEARCQLDQICRLKRVEEEIKEQHHTMAKYKKKIKLLTKERESLKKTLQKRNQTIINLNKENSKLKQQILSLQTMESVRYNSDDNITEYNTDVDGLNHSNSQSAASRHAHGHTRNTNSFFGSNSNTLTAAISPPMHQKTFHHQHHGYNPSSTSNVTTSAASQSPSSSVPHRLAARQLMQDGVGNAPNSDDSKSNVQKPHIVDEHQRPEEHEQEQESGSLDIEEIKRLEAELNLSKQNNANWQNAVDQLQTLADQQQVVTEKHTVNVQDTAAGDADKDGLTEQPAQDAMSQLVETLNATNVNMNGSHITPGGDEQDIEDRLDESEEDVVENVVIDDDDEDQQEYGDLPLSPNNCTNDAAEIMKQNMNTLTDTTMKNESILSEIQSQWMQAETDKLNFKKLYEKEKAKVNEYKTKTVVAYKKYEKSEIELSIAQRHLEELQQKHEVMEEVYMKLKQDLTRMMDKYSKLEYEYEKVKEKLRQREQAIIANET